MNFTLLTFDTLDSTNTEALRQAKAGAPEGLCIIAREQTAGRGRQGRTWVSEKDAGLYFSVIVRPKIEVRLLPLLTIATGVAVHDTLAELGLRPDIKWVNDILIGDKKVAGILAETADTLNGTAVVVGIGINLRSSNFPPDLAHTATSIEDSLGRTVSAPELAERLTRQLDQWLGKVPDPVIDEWCRRSTYASGKRVRVDTGGDVITGVTDGLESNGALRVKRDDGTVAVVQAGDVERLRTDSD